MALLDGLDVMLANVYLGAYRSDFAECTAEVYVCREDDSECDMDLHYLSSLVIEWGDGQTSRYIAPILTSPNPITHKYATKGYKTIKLRATTLLGRVETHETVYWVDPDET